MDKKEIAKDLTVAFLENRAGRLVSLEDAVLAYEKFYEAVNRSESVGEFGYIEPSDFVRNTEE
ncbi:hypothetical protein [Bacillus pretiosus]|uniref:hypothetical protein n=1 Tax=Bacillus pretiosus TaxID=2983392 RepID=UPI002ED890AB